MTARALCISPRCRSFGKHAEGCADDECRGCQPRQSADGLNLCRVCTRRLAEDIAEVGRLHAELGLVLTAPERAGERVSGESANPSVTLNGRAMHARTAIYRALTICAQLVVSERGVRAPMDQPAAIASFLGRHVDWLAAHRTAGKVAAGMAELAHGPIRRIAYPTGVRVFEVAPCPVTDDDDAPCGGTIKAILRHADALLPSELVCDLDDEHRWNCTAWLKLGHKLQEMRGAA